MSQCHDTYERGFHTVGAAAVPPGTQCHDIVGGDVLGRSVDALDTELALAGAVLDWAHQVAPNDEWIARTAVDRALYALARGASVPEAFSEARERIGSRLRHPARRPVPPLAAAS
jgi:hypothetical protein